ncbi:MAG: hypothetical protein ACRCYR_09075 [Phycicoccus sp.]
MSSQHHILLGGGGADPRDSELADGYLRAMRRLTAVMAGAQRRQELDDDVPAWWLVDAFVALLVTAGIAGGRSTSRLGPRGHRPSGGERRGLVG